MLKQGAVAGGAALTAQSAISAGLNVTVDVNLGGSIGLKSINVAQLLQTAASNGTLETWMSGPLASEFRVQTTLTTGLRAIFDVRVTADGNVMTDVILANDSTFTPNIHSFTYSITIKQGSTVVLSETNLFHHANSTWHEQVWLRGEPAINVQRDVDYLIGTGAVPSVDTGQGVSAATIQSEYNALGSADTGPLGSAFVQQYMPNTGGRADIGPMPEWYARYLATQDARALEVMLANADAAGSVPWHYTAEATGDPVRMDMYPNLWIDARAVGGSGRLPDISSGSAMGGWTPETAHDPALSYLPYLFTGSHYYLDELQAQAAWSIAARDPVNSPEPGVMAAWNEQTRAYAWTLRNLMDAAYLTPDGDPMKGYFTGLVQANIDELVQAFVVGGANNAAGQIEGWIQSYETTYSGILKPWQMDFLTVVMAEADARGYAGADTLLAWMENFVAGRFTSGELGFNPAAGPAYELRIRDGSGNLIDTWAEAYQALGGNPANALTDMGLDGGSYPDWSGGYAANARAALASLASVTGSAQAFEAYGYVISKTFHQAADSFETNPLWNLTPKLADGSYLKSSDMIVDAGGAGSNRTGTAANELIYGGSGNNTIGGGGGIDILFGGGGDDLVQGGDGGDYLYGNAGNDRLDGGNGNDFLTGGMGNDTLTGGQGADQFVWEYQGGRDVITDFTPGQGDNILLNDTNLYGINTFAQLQARMSQDAAGVTIALDANNSILLQNTTIAQLAAQHFIFS
jgi:hypothetical protein